MRHPPSPQQFRGDEDRVVRDIASCRTPQLGGHRWRCTDCGYETRLYNSCRNRHCPTCQGLQSQHWVDRRLEDLLPIPYFHVVFTIPPQLHSWFCRCPRIAYAQIFAAAAEAMVAVCRSNLGATPGVICVLHTWTQTLLFHPHVHCIVTGGGLSLDGQRWIASRQNFLVPVRRLSLVFRAKLLEKMAERTRPPRTPKKWCVYCKTPMAGPVQVVRYLGRYTHRIAISDRRILKLTDRHVTFSFRNRKRGNCRDTLTLPIQGFVARFLWHVVPRHFVRIRYYGILANAFKAKRLAHARTLLGAPAPPQPQPDRYLTENSQRLVGYDPRLCPSCGHGTLCFLEPIAPHPCRPP